MKTFNKIIFSAILLLFIHIGVISTYAYQVDELPHTKTVSMHMIKDSKKSLKNVSGSDVATIVNAMNSKKDRITIKAKTEKKINAYIDIINYLYGNYIEFDPSVLVTGDGYSFILNKDKIRSFKKKNKMVDQFFQKEMLSLGITSNTTEYEAVRRINDWICKNMSYDNTYTHITANDMLSTGTGVCSAYAELFVKICNFYGIKSKYVTNTVTLNHAWNLVCIDDIWYEIDICWNDASSSYNYFLMTREESSRIHKTYISEKDIAFYTGEYYKISYKMNGGIKNKDNISLYIPDIDNPLPNPEKEGYRFVGWYIGNKKITNTKNMTGNITLTAKWKKI